MWKEKKYKKKPVIDEQQMNEINMKLQIAIHNNLNVIIEYYKDYETYKINGKVRKVDSLRKYLQLNDSNYTSIPVSDILNVQID